MKNKCPNCEVELEYAHVSDQWAGDVLMTASCKYCPKCLYTENENIRLSK